MDKDKLWYLSRINLFSDLDPATLKELDRVSPMVLVPRGAILLRPDEPPSVLYFLKRGRVRLYKVKPDGREVTLAVLGDGNVFGATGSIDLGGEGTYAQVMDEALVCAMHLADVEELLRRQPAVAMRLISLLGERVRDLETMVENLTHLDVGCRLLFLLTGLAKDFGTAADDGFTCLDVPLTHEEIATMVGSTRETVSATLSRLAKEGIVRTGRRQVQIQLTAAAAVLAGNGDGCVSGSVP